MGAEASKLLKAHFKGMLNDPPTDEETQAKSIDKLFSLIDADNSGKIEKNELPALMDGISKSFKALTGTEINPMFINAISQDAASVDFSKDDIAAIVNDTFGLIQQKKAMSESTAVKKSKTSIAKKIRLRRSNLSQEELDSYYNARTLDDILPELDTGDILLFRGQGEVSKVIKNITFCCFSHVAMVLRDPPEEIRTEYCIDPNEKETVFIFESNATTQPPRPGGGTHIVPLRWKLERAVRKEDPDYLLCVRKLNLPQRGATMEETFPDLKNFILAMSGVSYEMQKLDLLASTTAIVARPFEEDLTSVFCTELLSANYKRMGLLPSNLNPTNSIPRTFTSNQRLLGKFELLRNATLEREVRIRCSKSRETLVKEYDASLPAGKAKPEPTQISEKLHIQVNQCSNLGHSNAYVQIKYRENKAKTKAKKKNIWNEAFDFDLMSDWDDPDEDNHLAFLVFKSCLPSDQFLGMAFVDLSAISEALKNGEPIEIMKNGARLNTSPKTAQEQKKIHVDLSLVKA